MPKLHQEALTKCPIDLLQSKNYAAIAAQINIDRKKPNANLIGNGAILAVLGLDVGNALLDEVNTNAAFRHVKPLIDQGRLDISSPLVQQTIMSFVPALLTQQQADALMGLGYDDDYVTEADVEAGIDWSQLS